MDQDRFSLDLDLADERATVALAEDIAAAVVPGDVIALAGGLGAGKTTFARAFVRSLAGDPELDVPSPTFTLVQTYEGRLPVAHFDLYRLASPEELEEIGFADAGIDGVVLVEWPERAGGRLPRERLDVGFAIAGAGRHVRIEGDAGWRERLQRRLAGRAFLDRAGWTGAHRRHLQGDASTRRYERVRDGLRRAVLMDWPPAPPLEPGDRRAVFRARDVGAFVAVDRGLAGLGLSVPDIYAADLDLGFLLLEDFGSDGILRDDGSPDPERYRTAVEILAEIHAAPRPLRLPVAPGRDHAVPAYSAEAFAVEAHFFAEWYAPFLLKRALTTTAQIEFRQIWERLADRLGAFERNWVLLDYHSPNLLWLPQRSGLKRIGILDFQDLLFGPSAYDVASLCQDARVTIPAGLEADLCARYLAIRSERDPHFDAAAFGEAYAILATHRATKVLGVFAKLAENAGRREYLRHMPRLREYLSRSLAHPALTGYALWYEGHLPQAV